MPTTRRSVALALFLALASGCTESPGARRKLVPIQSARGLITYRYEDEETAAGTPTPSGRVWGAQPPWDDAADRQRRQDERYDRDMAQWRRDRGEQARREAREEDAYQAMNRGLRQAQASQERREWLAYRDQEANRRETLQREAQERSRAEMRSQQEAAANASLLRLQQGQLEQQANFLRP